ncbi:MAG: ribosomal protein S18-alanine N-acetyltransferase [Clostridiaceae bacterium]|nr:ribosomal protein S18-alanine N-acetyltransferase [Clostridiaceae bacterium]
MLDGKESVRPATADDAAELAEIEQACFAIPWSFESLQHDLSANPAAHYWVIAAANGRLAGYAAYWQVMDEAQITNIAVLPAYRRRGFGRRLMRQMMMQAASDHLTHMVLEVRQSNQAARSLYESEGFLPVGLRRGYYADNGESAITMLKIVGKNDV